MSRPGSSAESLEAILASIRRSLAEQAANELEEAAAAPEPSPGAPPIGGVAPAVTEHLSLPLAGAAPDMPTGNARDLEVRPPADAFPEEPLPAPAAPPPAPDPAPDPAPPPPATTGESAAEPEPDGRKAKDPLWFLGRETTQPAATPAAAFDTRPSAAANDARETPGAAPADRTPEPKPHPGHSPGPPPGHPPGASAAIALRAPRPPFFGSNVETVQVEVAPAPPVLPRTAGPLPPGPIAPASSPVSRAGPASVSAHGPAHGPAHGLNGAATRGNGLDGLETAPRPADAPQAGQPPGAAAGPESQTAGGDALPQIPGLEAVVAELLRPMLRQWLDENMPRLVSAALEAEIRSRRDPKKP